MTSANLSDDPIIYEDDYKLLSRLADNIVWHNRKIYIFTDDSVAQVFEKKLYMIRRSRGYVPSPRKLPLKSTKTILGLGAMLKTTFSFLHKDMAIISQYIGNTDSLASVKAEEKTIGFYQKIFHLQPDIIVLDKHPYYPNRLLARNFPQAKHLEVQHHRAHVGSLLAENQEMGKIIGLAMDGTGFGDDGKIWGGEVFTGDFRDLSRFAHFKNLFLPSGDKSIKEPWRFALSILYSLYGNDQKVVRFAEKFSSTGKVILNIIRSNQAGIETSSLGRIFDAVATLMGLGDFCSYDGELPTKLQARAENGAINSETYSYGLEQSQKPIQINLLPVIDDMLNDRRDINTRALIFHNTLARSFLEVARMARDQFDINKVGLTGGVFQNILLLKLTKELLEKNRFSVIIHSEIPPNDGGVSLGQVFLAAGKIL